MNIRVLYNEGNFLTSLGTVSLKRSIPLHWTYLFVCLFVNSADFYKTPLFMMTVGVWRTKGPP